jgi:CubicO group peptidase (beta-lactamase class C family)
MEMSCDRNNPERARGIELHPMPSPSAGRPTPLPKEKIAEAAIPETIAKHLSETVALDLFSGVVLVAKDDHVLLHQPYGMANKELRITNRVDTRFGSASVGKMFTGVAIAQLVEAGKLRFEDTIGSVLPDYPNGEAATHVTIHQLLTHSSGVADPFESPNYKSGVKRPRQSDWFPLFAHEPLKFKPGARHAYSNGGYVVLAAIIEKLRGQSFADFLCEHIFRPAGLRATGCVAKEADATSIAAPHRRLMLQDPLGIEPRVVKGAPSFKHDAAGMGGWQTTTEDLFRFARALRTNGLLSAAMTKQATTGKVSVFGERVKYAYGFYDMEARGDRMVGHSGGGGDLAVAGELEMLWDSGYTVAILSNYDLEETRRLAMDILRFLKSQQTATAGQ